MFRRHTPAWAPALTAAGIVLLIPTAAHAAVPWDGTNPLAGPDDSMVMKFVANGFFFKFDDIDLSDSGNNADAFDDFGVVTIVEDSLGLTGTAYDYILGTGENFDQWVSCGEDPAAIAFEEDPATGDIILSCSAIDAELEQAGLAVDLEFRVFADGTTVRSMVSITNLGDTDVVLDNVIIEFEFGSEGQIIATGGPDATPLAVPIQEDGGVSHADLLNEASTQWLVHDDFDNGPSQAADWPSAIVIGGGTGAAAEAQWLASGMDTYLATVADLALAVGETRSIVTFGAVAPEPLLGIGFANFSGNFTTELEASAEQLIAGMGRFAQLDDRLAAGIADTSQVVNWPEPTNPPAELPQPELAATGPDDLAGPAALAAFTLVLIGATAGLAQRRRSARHVSDR
jgi:hypothetical protein